MFEHVFKEIIVIIDINKDMEHKTYSPSPSKSISSILLGTHETRDKNAHALYSLQRLDSTQRLEPYLYKHILGYQSFDSNIHTPKYAIKTNNIDLVKYLISNDLWDMDAIDALDLSLRHLSDDVFIYLVKSFELPIERIEDDLDWDKVPWWEGEPYSSWTLKLTLFFLDTFNPPEVEDGSSYIGNRMMINAVNTHDIELVSTVISRGWSTHWSDALGLYGYLRNDLDLDIVKYLIEKGANPTEGISNAAAKGSLDIVKYLIEVGANPTIGISHAIDGKHFNIVKYLVEHGADLRDIYANYPNDIDIVKYLVEKGANVNNILPMIVQHDKIDIDIVKYLIEKGADINKAPLIWYFVHKHYDILKYLIENKAIEVSILLQELSNRKHWDVIRHLVSDNIIDVDYAMLQGHGNLENVKLLVEESE